MAFEFDGRLKDWVGSVLQHAEVSLAAPEAKRGGRGVGLYLLELAPSPPPSSNKRPPRQLILRYLVTTWSDDPEDAHEMLVSLMLDAMDNKDFQIEQESIAVTVWRAFGLPPQPSFVLRVPLRQERPQPQAKLVREAMKVHSSPVVAFHGILLGPGDVPLSDCRVEFPALNLATRTDYKGRFHFASLPGEGSKQFVVKAKGFELPVSSNDDHPDSQQPLVIHFSPLEE